jgi:hypothetical protein
MILRNSEVTDYLRCRLRWQYRWYRQLEPKRKSTKLVLGTLFHKFLETYYAFNTLLPGRRLQEAVDAMKGMYDEQVAAKIEQGTYDPVEASGMWDLLEGLARWYHEYWSDKQVDTWEVLATEQTYYINMRTLEWTTDRSVAEAADDDIWYECTIDLAIRINGKLYIVDHKTASSISTFVEKTEMDRQISRYLFAANVIFREEIHGLIYNVIKKEIPHEPTQLKKGGLSKAKDQRTTFTMYLNKLVELGIAKDPQDGAVDPETWKVFNGYAIDPDHAEVLQLLMQRELPNGQGNDFLRRVLVKRNKDEMNNAMLEFMQVATAIRKLRRFLDKFSDKVHPYDNPIYRNITNDCSWDCGYRSCCVAGMDGSDVGYLEEELLEPVEDHYETESEAV